MAEYSWGNTAGGGCGGNLQRGVAVNIDVWGGHTSYTVPAGKQFVGTITMSAATPGGQNTNIFVNSANIFQLNAASYLPNFVGAPGDVLTTSNDAKIHLNGFLYDQP